MAWSIYADQFLNSEMSNKQRYLRFKVDENSVIKAMRTWLIFYNPGSFTNLRCSIYADRDGIPGGLIATSSNSWQRSDLLTSNNYAAIEVYFEFGNISLNESVYHHFVLSCDGYSFTEDSHISWRKAWPDPIYGGPVTFNQLLRSPYMFALIGAEL
jgi:hypothetical protein